MKAGLVLVTGASGYIGSNVVQLLLQEGYSVRGTVRSTTGPKVQHLLDMGEKLELVAADLTKDDGWEDAARGCDYCLHVASPFILNVSDDDADTLIKPAVDGTLRVLGACAAAGTIKRVVLTSSIAAIIAGWEPEAGKELQEPETHWSVAEKCDAYSKSKTLAERAAWDYVERKAAAGESVFELTTINPGFVIGPALSANDATSFDVARKLLTRAMPAVPALSLVMVDVRDVASAHVAAMTSAAAAGQRFVCAAETRWLRDLALSVAAPFKPLGYRVPTAPLPKLLLRIAGLFDKSVRGLVSQVDKQVFLDNSKSRTVLGLEYRSVAQSFPDMCHSLIRLGYIPKTKQYAAWEAASAAAPAASAEAAAPAPPAVVTTAIAASADGGVPATSTADSAQPAAAAAAAAEL
ncbi:hypothetical protein JKP88DRAFT_203281 [Tribonema minus]|uniref:NAD-dependent epimerase/dehydratase domain-containing protein n=1 Tax=Tribonema minus TaxID=303371 RepID=A0A836C8Q1_9STRA|nr:hypothetical protein JKP88DRAFT_203281 [Tribonema minus]